MDDDTRRDIGHARETARARTRRTPASPSTTVQNVRNPLLDERNLVALLTLPLGFGAFGLISEWQAWVNRGESSRAAREGEEAICYGCASVVYWHVAFFLASAVSFEHPVVSFLLCISTLITPLHFETVSLVRVMHTMAFFTHALRLFMILLASTTTSSKAMMATTTTTTTRQQHPIRDAELFREAKWDFRILFVHYYHDLREARKLNDSRGERREELMHATKAMTISLVMVALSSSFLSYTRGVATATATTTDDHASRRLLATAFHGVRQLAACLYFYFNLRVVDDLYRLPLILVLDVAVPSTFGERVFASRTLGVFWRRWNVVIQSLLYGGVYRPLVAWSVPRWGARFLTFVASGLLHVVPVWLLMVGKGQGDSTDARRQIAQMFLFFVLQTLLIQIEAAFNLEGPLWIAFAFVVSASLFLDPFMKSLEL